MRRHRWLLVVVLGILAVGAASGATGTLKPYDPFDEPKPKQPKEILTDTRLDKHVKVFVKSKNLQQLFGELTAKTGVKTQVSQSLRGERAIIYFHDRPLRDVMTEVSNLFGYYWSVDGTPGHYRYGLYEDIRHAKRREQLRQAPVEFQSEVFLEYLRKLAAGTLNEEAMKRLQSSDPNFYRWITHSGAKEEVGLLLQLGEPFLRKVMAGDGVSCRFAELPPQWQAAMCEKANRFNAGVWDSAKAQGIQVPELVPFTPEAMASVIVETKMSGRSAYHAGSLELKVKLPDEDRYFLGLRVSPPREQVARDLTGMEPVSKMGGDPLPEKPEITIKELRWVSFFQRGWVLGDILQAMAEQSDMDSIADYYHRGSGSKPVQKAPIGKLVASMCDDLDYSGRYDGTTIRLRSNKWFVQPLCEDPPASLIEACWKSLAENGCISLDVQMAIASLPDKRMQWPGFGMIHGAACSDEKDSLRLLAALGPALRSQAQSERGLPASSLMPDLYNQFAQWAATLKPGVAAGDLPQSVITLKFTKIWSDDGGDHYDLACNLPDGSSCSDRISLLQLEGGSRKGMTEWHLKDLKADLIEVLD